jgi:hypothetical protein
MKRALWMTLKMITSSLKHEKCVMDDIENDQLFIKNMRSALWMTLQMIKVY